MFMIKKIFAVIVCACLCFGVLVGAVSLYFINKKGSIVEKTYDNEVVTSNEESSGKPDVTENETTGNVDSFGTVPPQTTQKPQASTSDHSGESAKPPHTLKPSETVTSPPATTEKPDETVMLPPAETGKPAETQRPTIELPFDKFE